MRFKVFKNTALLFVFVVIACASKSNDKAIKNDSAKALSNALETIIVGANHTEAYIPFLKGKRVGIVANQTSVIFENKTDSIYEIDPETNDLLLYEVTNRNKHIVDSLLRLNINIKKVFSPEHGFRGNVDAGENGYMNA